MRTKSDSPRGFALLLAVAMSVALLGIVVAMQTMGQSRTLSRQAEKDQLIARQAAEAGLARARNDAVKLVGNLKQVDLDCMLDPALDSSGPTVNLSDNNLPPATGTTIATQCSTAGADYKVWGDADVAAETVYGIAYRRVPLDMDGDGKIESAYLVRYDDNLDDNPAMGPSGTTNQQKGASGGPCCNGGEGSATIEATNRDRDQAIIVTAIGYTGGTSFANARVRRMLRGTLKASGGLSFLTPGRNFFNDVGGDDQHGQICGGGGMFCDVGEGTGRNPVCACGTIYTEDSSSEVWPVTVPTCPIGTGPGECSSCAPLQVVTNSTSPDPCAVPDPTPPSAPTFVVDRLNRLENVPNMCYFNVQYQATGTRVIIYVWDHSAGAGACAGPFSAGSAIPVANPGFAGTGDFVTLDDCWVPIYDEPTGGAWDHSTSGLPRDIVGGGATCASTPGRLAAFGTGGITTAYDYVGECAAGAGVVMSFSGTTALVAIHPNRPKGIYYFTSFSQVGVDGDGTTVDDPTSVGVVINGGNFNNASSDGDLFMHNPGPDTLHAIVASGSCTFLGNNTRYDHGIWCGGAVQFASNPGPVRLGGDLFSGNNLQWTGNATAFSIVGGDPPTVWPSTCTGTAKVWVNGNCLIENGPLFCANIECTNNVTIDNAGTIFGTVYAGGNIDMGPEGILDPMGGGSMVGSVPQIVGVQEIGL